ncbi:MAG TPA: hypothetical protein VKU19_29040 [Bryobacteraceae bacterium]|nr:hypothetical protein [Bryobacteraceae bacterium]
MRSLTISVPCLIVAGALAGVAQSLPTLNLFPSRIVGHPLPEQNVLSSVNPNLVEGRELFGPEGIALDTSASPPILYVADTFNNRVLAWQNASGFTNGQKADLVIGQIDFYSTQAQGPGRQFQTGLSAPTGLAVSGGDLYIADSGNNRVLRFRKPFQNAGNLFPDLFIGQPNLNSNIPNNNGTSGPSAVGLNFISNGKLQTVNLTFDTAGNLWMTDPGNRRVLRFAASDLASGGGPLTANLLIGNLGIFTSVQPAITAATATQGNLFATPSALAFDPAGRLFVSDGDGTSFARVLVFLPPFTNSSSASRIMGVFPPNSTPAQDQISKTVFYSINSIFFVPGSTPKVGLVDQLGSRILLFDSYDNWPDPSTSFSPQATAVVGQPSFTSLNANAGTTFIPPSSTSTLYYPSAAVLQGNDLFVADAGNNRVLDLPVVNSVPGPATRVLGQDRFDMSASNLIEGKEFDFTASTSSGTIAEGGVTIDNSGDTPHLYVADFANNRVLGFKDFRSLAANVRADIVIGQADFNSGLCNQTGDPNHLTAGTLCRPTSVITDSNGNLYVADSGNGRVLRFPAPFAHQGLEQADLVLGQHNFNTKITDPSSFTMSAPYGLAFAANNGLLVSDVVHNRVLFFAFNSSGGFDPTADSGKAASKVLGQQNFTTTTSGNADSQMNGPRHIAADTDGRPYVVDTGNNRVMIFDGIGAAPSGASAAHILNGFNVPHGIFVNQTTGEIWVTNTNSGTVLRFPQYQSLLLSDASNGGVQDAGAPVDVTQDPYGDLIVADASNRVALYFPGVQAMNGANFIPSYHLSPGMLAALCAANSNCSNGAAIFGANTVDNSTRPNPLPMPTSLDNVQLNLNFTDSNGNPQTVAAPLYYVSPTQIVFYVPMSAPTSGTVNLEVVQTTTGRLYAAGPTTMNTYSPAVFMQQYAGKLRPASVLNQDNTLNSPSNPALRGSTIQIFATGQGFVPGAPSDGSAAPSPPLNTPFTPRVGINFIYTDQYTPGQGDPADKQFVSFSGLAPGEVGVWQINVQIPINVSPGAQIPLYISTGSLLSTDGSFYTTIAVK